MNDMEDGRSEVVQEDRIDIDDLGDISSNASFQGGALRGFLRWTLVVLLSAWALGLVGIGFAVSLDSYGGLGPLYLCLFIALANVVAAYPFLVPSSPEYLLVARGIACVEGAVVGLAALAINAMADSIVSMGNSKGGTLSPVAVFGLAIGGGIVFLAIFAQAPPMTLDPNATSNPVDSQTSE